MKKINFEGRSHFIPMVPGSEKITEQGHGVFRSWFAAVFEATDPRKENHAKMTPPITIGCTLDWEI